MFEPKKTYVLVYGGLVGLVAFFLAFDPRCLLPWEVDWLMRGDTAMHQIGWEFFRYEPLRWPLGRLERYVAPPGTSIVLTDSIPLLALLTRPLARLAGPDVQYFGVWLLACFVALPLLGVWTLRTLGVSVAAQLAGATVLGFFPPLAWRFFGNAGIRHPSLCGQFLLLIGIGLFVRPLHEHVTLGWRWLALLVCTLLVHGYLFAMVVALYAAWTSMVAFKCRPAARWWVEQGLVAATVAGVMVVVGIVGGSPRLGWGYIGVYATSLDAFVNPIGFSALYSGWAVPVGRSEGMSYLGLGGLLVVGGGLLSTVLVHIGRGRPRADPPLPVETNLRWLGGCCALLAVFALSDRVVIGSTLVVDLSPIYRPFSRLTSVFFASGRFVWPLAYFAVLWGFWTCDRWLPRTARTGAFLGVALAAVLDVAPVLATRPPLPSGPAVLAHPAWEASAADFDALMPVPGHYPRTDCRNKAVGWQRQIPLARYAARHGLVHYSGYATRPDATVIEAHCRTAVRQLTDAPIPARTLVFPSAALFSELVSRTTTGRMPHNALCGVLDGYHLCVAADGTSPIHTALRSAVAR